MASAWDCPRCTFANPPASPAASWREAECAVCGYRRAHVDLDDDDVDERVPEERHVAAEERDAAATTLPCPVSAPPCPFPTSPPHLPLPDCAQLPPAHRGSNDGEAALGAERGSEGGSGAEGEGSGGLKVEEMRDGGAGERGSGEKETGEDGGVGRGEERGEVGRGAEGKSGNEWLRLLHEARVKRQGRDETSAGARGGSESRTHTHKVKEEKEEKKKQDEQEPERAKEKEPGVCAMSPTFLPLLCTCTAPTATCCKAHSLIPMGKGQQGRGSRGVTSTSGSASTRVSIMTWNVWFNEEAALQHRMAAIGTAIHHDRPHVVCLQEVTPSIVELFSSQPWFTEYRPCSPLHDRHMPPYFCLILSRLAVQLQHVHPFANSIMGRQLLITSFHLPPFASPASSAPPCVLTVATSHLESPCPAPPMWDQHFSPQRVQQAAEALRLLHSHQWRERGAGKKRAREESGAGNGRRSGEGEGGGEMEDVVFCGDMNWNDKRDGDVPMPQGWVDAWVQLHPREAGFTYDSRVNPMLAGGRLRLRLDRCWLRLHHLHLHSLSLLGTHPIPGGSYSKQRRVKGQPTMVDLPLLPSDHFGLLLVLERGEGGAVGDGRGRAVASGGDGGGGGVGGDGGSKGGEEQGGRGDGERKVRSSKKGGTRAKDT
ncbi:unnamed protein product [Closterium sp. Naga37s-1]|nr:unnamed protein product [Closterium sp. Naga37s-1]